MIDLTPSIPYIIGAFLGAFTTFFGYCLNEYSKKKDKRYQRVAARRMIKFEIDHDLKLLEEFYSEIKDAAEENDGSLGYNMGNLSFPPADKSVFNKYSFLLSDSKENEFENVYNFYRIVGDLQIIHSKTGKISKKAYQPIYSPINLNENAISGDTGESEYSSQFTEFWAEFELLICSLIKEGNPIIL